MKTRYHQWTEEEIKEMKKLLLSGKTIIDLAKLHNTTFQNISYTMERFGETVTSIREIRKKIIAEKRAAKKILADAKAEIKAREAFFKKWSDISSYKAPRRVYNDSRVLKDDPKSIANRKRQEAYREANFLKVLARRVVGYALKRGYIFIQPCNECGCMDNIEFHHPDYSKALDVVCLCKKCHNDRHAGDNWHSDREGV